MKGNDESLKWSSFQIGGLKASAKSSIFQWVLSHQPREEMLNRRSSEFLRSNLGSFRVIWLISMNWKTGLWPSFMGSCLQYSSLGILVSMSSCPVFSLFVLPSIYVCQCNTFWYKSLQWRSQLNTAFGDENIERTSLQAIINSYTKNEILQFKKKIDLVLGSC